MSNEQGLSLADIAGLKTRVPVGASYIEVRGISAADALKLLQRFPHLLEAGFKAGGDVKLADLLGAAPETIAAALAAGVGKLGDPEAEASAAAVPIEIQMDLLEAIGGLTFRSGFGPFVARLTALAKSAKGSGSLGKVPDMRSPLE